MTEIDKDKLASHTETLADFNRGIVDEFRANDGKVGALPGVVSLCCSIRRVPSPARPGCRRSRICPSTGGC
jgi:hypothetical protein